MAEPMDLSDEAIFACADSVRLAGTGAIAGLMRHIRDATTAAERQRCIAILTTYATGDAHRVVNVALAALRGGDHE